MKLKLISFGDAGNMSEERIGFRVLQPCNLKFFVVYHTENKERGFYNRPKHVFWFYPKDVNVGDEVVLYTKDGVDSTEERNGHKIHFIYWRLQEPILEAGDCIVLSEVNDWSVTPYMEGD